MPDVAENVILTRQEHDRLMTLVDRCKAMRRYQRAFFRGRRPDDMRFARDYEKKVDDLIVVIENHAEKSGQPTLF